MESQEKVWDEIASEWHEFKLAPSQTATDLINSSFGKILDFGSGSGRNLLKVKNGKDRKFYLVDFSGEMLKLAEKRAEELNLNVMTMKSELDSVDFPDNYFDAAVCTAAIHCLTTEKKREDAVKELHRVLKPGAKAVVEVWNKNSKRFAKRPKERFVSWRDRGSRYYYLYDEDEFRELLEKTGFKIIEKVPHSANIIFVVKKI